ncbi:protein SMAX1-LIKE 3-like [Malania oleifera]|uniref:protein SMAX1-LIKE 3-like n=1 Tax=Malania oleifera TaxID=397392 RepID=UPI0025AEA1EE|nr:protein SMAX1-LIKE 3-like [Malania oleifera]
MRTGGVCTVQQALTAEAASVVKQAVSLAKRRGHAQVTPLHVASAMLASGGGLLQIACRKSHSHPLQCKALELCFNVALNRLPTSASSPLFGPQHLPHPSLSNALVAAFKRAQAHQRRGSIENQQQPILALKIEIEQLVISILDDPSVSRVMREAGFSSTQVKTNVEQAVSLEVCSQSPSISSRSKGSTSPLVLGSNVIQSPHQGQLGVTLTGKTSEQVGSDDVMSVLDRLMTKRRRNTVIVGECLASIECLVRKVMDKFERADVPGHLRYVQFISLPLFSLKNLSRDEVEKKLIELKCLIKSYLGRGVVLYLGDLKWVSEMWSNYGEQRKNFYCPVEHMVMELRRMVCGISDGSGKIWLIGIATLKTYMKCKMGHPSLETIWELHPLAIPVGSLDLSLNLDSNFPAQSRSKVISGDGFSMPLLESRDKLTCCADCYANFAREAKSIRNNDSTTSTPTISSSTSLPLWLQQCKEESRSLTINDQEGIQIRDLCKKWNSICSSVHKSNLAEKALTFSLSPSSSISISSYDQHTPKLHQTILGWPLIFESNQLPKEHQFWTFEKSEEDFEPSLRMHKPETKPDLLSNPNSSPNSASSSEAMEDLECLNRFKELNSENMKILCNALEKKVPWQKDTIPEIVSTILQCRSRMMRRKGNLKQREDKEETWMFFLGLESEGKERIARELAKLIFGSQNNYVSIGMSSFASTRADSTDDLGNKRSRDEFGRSYLERFAEAVHENPHRMFFMEDIEQVDRRSQMGIKRATESGILTLPGGELVSLEDAIIILSCESLSSVSRACSPPLRQKCSEDEEKGLDDDLEERSPCISLDLNIAIEDDNGDEQSVSDMDILESVDRQIIFKTQEL